MPSWSVNHPERRGGALVSGTGGARTCGTGAVFVQPTRAAKSVAALCRGLRISFKFSSSSKIFGGVVAEMPRCLVFTLVCNHDE